MYDQSFSRLTPGCIVVLLDRSDSMKAQWKGTELTLAEGAALAVNKLLLDLCVKSTKEVGAAPRHYFDIGVFGYGLTPSGQGEGVESAFAGVLAGEAVIGLPQLATNPVAVRETPSVDAVAFAAKTPVWIEAVHGYRTPMCEAVAVAGAHVYDWAGAHPDSFPPIVINITDGLVTDSPHEGADLAGWAQRLTTITTNHGPTLMFNIFLSPSGTDPVLLPTSATGLPQPGPELFDISSPLPPGMVAAAQKEGIAVGPGARGFAFNADLATLVKFLEVGTRVTSVRDR